MKRLIAIVAGLLATSVKGETTYLILKTRQGGETMKRKLVVIAGAVLAAVTAGIGAVPVTAEASPNPPGYTGGGVWVHPAAPNAQWGVNGPMDIVAKVTNQATAPVGEIVFTGTWPELNGNWEILTENGNQPCAFQVYPSGPTTFTCNFDPSAAGIQQISDNITLSFDVYETYQPDPKNLGPPMNQSPNGEHVVTWGWVCITGPGGGCNGW